MLRLAHSTGHRAAGATAVLLDGSGSARRVDRRARELVGALVPDEDVFVSRAPEDAERIAETVVARRYRTVFTGGGDGTFVSWVNQILDRAERRRAPAPRFGVLGLGAREALAKVAGARRQVGDLERYLRGEVTHTRKLHLLECEGRRTPFAGVGLDAAVVADREWMRRTLDRTPLRAVTGGLPALALSLALRSAPRSVLEGRAPYCEVMSTGDEAYRLDAWGNHLGPPIRRGELLYAGPCTLAVAGTVPYFAGLRAFPFAAARPGMMQLRVVTRIPLRDAVAGVRRIWAGDFAHPGLLDFHAEEVAITFERPVPLQVGGAAQGRREEVTFGMAPSVLDLLDFRGAGGQVH
jgi:diacylglycerol kinase family enzyme